MAGRDDILMRDRRQWRTAPDDPPTTPQGSIPEDAYTFTEQQVNDFEKQITQGNAAGAIPERDRMPVSSTTTTTKATPKVQTPKTPAASTPQQSTAPAGSAVGSLGVTKPSVPVGYTAVDQAQAAAEATEANKKDIRARYGVTPQMSDHEAVSRFLGYTPETEDQRKERERREAINRRIAAVGDAISAIAGMHYVGKGGLPNSTMPSLEGKMRERYEHLDELRRRKGKEWVEAYIQLQRQKLAAQQEQRYAEQQEALAQYRRDMADINREKIEQRASQFERQEDRKDKELEQKRQNNAEKNAIAQQKAANAGKKGGGGRGRGGRGGGKSNSDKVTTTITETDPKTGRKKTVTTVTHGSRQGVYSGFSIKNKK